MRPTLALMLPARPLQARPLQAETLSQDIARTNLATAKTAIPATSDLAVKIALDDLWFDVNQPGTRTPDEGLGDLVATLQPTTAGAPLPTVRFDVADAAWRPALANLDAPLTGQKLVPCWRISGAAGVDGGAMSYDPRPIDLVGWVHGWAAMPCLKQGHLVTRNSLAAFDSLMSGQAMLFALDLN